MRVLVTGAKGKVGSATVEALQAAGHEVTATDVVRGVFERPAAEDAIVLAVESKLPSHEVLRRDRRTTSGRIRSWKWRRSTTGTRAIRPVSREDASGISPVKAMKLLAWAPKRSWRDYLDDQGRLKPGVGKG